MPIFQENFDSYVAGNITPDGWTIAIPADWDVAAPASPFVEPSPPNVFVRNTGGSHEAILAPSSVIGPMITCSFFYGSSIGQSAGIVLYGENAGSSFSGYVCELNGSSTVLAITKFTGGGNTLLASQPFTISPNTWYTIQFGLDTATNTLVARAWSEHDPIPPGPTLKVNDNTYLSGEAGLFNDAFTGYYDSFSVDAYPPGSSGGSGSGVPTIGTNGISPTSGIVGTTVTITGTNFGTDTAGVKVAFNGTFATIVSVSATQIVCTVPDWATTGIVVVNNGQGPSTSTQTFTVLPNIETFQPTSGPVGTVVTINGTNFQPLIANDIVKFNGTMATVTQASYHSLTATVGVGSTTGHITVATTDGTATSAGIFTVGTNVAPVITSFTPTSGPIGTTVAITGTGFIAGAGNNTVIFSNGAAAAVTSATSTQIVATVPATAVTGLFTVGNVNGSATSPSAFTVTTGTGSGLPPDSFDCSTPDDGPLTCDGLTGYLRAMLKDTADDMEQLGIQSPIWSDASLCRFLELARGEYSRHRGKHNHILMTTVAQQQFYDNPAGCLGGRVEDVLWAPAGFDLDQISAMAAALAGGPGLVWGGGVPVVGRVYFDSPASITVWSIIREAWRNTFGGHWQASNNGFNLLPVPSESNLYILVKYRTETLWADIPWEHRAFILTRAFLYALESLTIQIASASTASSTKLTLGLRAMIMWAQQKYAEALVIREPGVTAGRS